MKDFCAKYAFFASANGGNGFKSYFDSVFNSKKFTKVFILKGGPGTGKSTFMKKVASFAEKEGLNYEIYLCSSDINSLDGVIVKNGNRSICVLDGTAPHQRDTEIPGAVDELINLGEAWDSTALESYRDKIESLNSKKQAHYKNAYDNLKNSAFFDRNIVAEIKKIFDYKKCQTACNDILGALSSYECGSAETKLISSFSKDGYQRLNTLNETCDNVYSVFGKYGEDLLFLSELSELAKERGIKITKFSSPFDESLTEAVSFEGVNLTLLADNSGKIIYDAADFCHIDSPSDFEKRFLILRGSADMYRSLAQDELLLASKYHFELEEVYSSAINFSDVDRIYMKTLGKIKNALCV